jgi:two-component system sensor histidine kinase HydH
MTPPKGPLRAALRPFLRGGEQRLVHPTRMAALLAGAYWLLCGAYIPISSGLAARASSSVKDLERLEVVKGIVFVLVTGAGLFAVSWLLLRHIAEQERRLEDQRSLLVSSERRAAAAMFAASAAHDINNVLTVAGGHVSRIAGTTALGPRERESTQRLESAILEIAKLSDHLLRLGRLGSGGSIEDLDVARIIRESVDFARTHRRVRHCEVLARLPDHEIHADLDASTMVQCLLNLVINAADAAGAGGRIEVRLAARGDDVVIEVHDNGPGVPPAQRQKIFEPFHTTKDGGSGLGLVSVKVCAEEHHGRVEVLESDLGGACFRLVLPGRVRSDPRTEQPSPAPRSAG